MMQLRSHSRAAGGGGDRGRIVAGEGLAGGL